MSKRFRNSIALTGILAGIHFGKLTLKSEDKSEIREVKDFYYDNNKNSVFNESESYLNLKDIIPPRYTSPFEKILQKTASSSNPKNPYSYWNLSEFEHPNPNTIPMVLVNGVWEMKR